MKERPAVAHSKPIKGLFDENRLYEIASQRGGLFCPYCGKAIESGIDKCPHCFAAINLSKLKSKEPIIIKEEIENGSDT